MNTIASAGARIAVLDRDYKKYRRLSLIMLIALGALYAVFITELLKSSDRTVLVSFVALTFQFLAGLSVFSKWHRVKVEKRLLSDLEQPGADGHRQP